LKEKVSKTAIVAANAKIDEAIDEAEVRKRASRACGTYLFMIQAQKLQEQLSVAIQPQTAATGINTRI